MAKIFKLFTAVMMEENRWEPDTWEPRIKVDWDHSGSSLATHGLGTITINMKVIVGELRTKGHHPGEVMPLGRILVENLAHEWRHFQQAVLWDTDIPQVSHSVMRSSDDPDNGVREGYWEDPGELDARQFASRVMAGIPDDVVMAVGRLARMGIRAKVRQARKEQDALLHSTR